MPMHNLIEYSNNYSKTSRSLRQYYRDEPALTDTGTVADFYSTDNTASFKFKQKVTSKIAANGRKYVQIIVLLKYLSNFWRILVMPLAHFQPVFYV